VRLRCSEAVIEAGEEFVALLGGDDSAGAAVGRIRATLNQTGGFEVIEQVGHDRTVDSEVLGQGELATDGALSGGGKHLVAPRTAGEVGHRGMGGLDVGPKNHAQAPSQVVRQRVVATLGAPYLVTVASGVVHDPIIRAGQRSVVDKMLCRHDYLSRIQLKKQGPSRDTKRRRYEREQ
jgi:hypothetical protein